MEKAISPEAKQFEASRKRVYEAHNRLLEILFGSVPENPSEHIVTHKEYTEALHKVKEEFKLEEGDPDMVLFVLEQLSRSPRFKKELNIDESTTMGKTIPSTTD